MEKNKKHVWIYRDLFFDKQASLGTVFVVLYDESGIKQLYKSDSLERGWVNNQNMISCLPIGDYPIGLEYSDKFERDLWEIKESYPRSECKFHVANFWYDLNGCIGPGYGRSYIDSDPIMDVSNSGDALRGFHAALAPDKEAILHIRNLFDL